MKRVMILLSVVGLLGLATGCLTPAPAAGPQITFVQEHRLHPIRNDWGPAVPLPGGVGHANSCIIRQSSVTGRSDLCRILFGSGLPGADAGNWHIVGTPNARYGSNTDQFGMTIEFTDQHLIFEGCDFISPNGSWDCDYEDGGTAVPVTVNEGTSWDYVLNATYNWEKYLGTAVGCVTGITSVIGGGVPVAATLLAACADGPMGSNFQSQSTGVKILPGKVTVG